MRKWIGVLLLIALLLPVAALAQSVPSTDEIAAGTYEGGFDTNGKRSGQGTWTYYNHLYQGQWENDLPNGQGTLYMGWTAGDDRGWEVIQGHWSDGFADGPIMYSTFFPGEEGWESSVYAFDVKKGFPLANATVVGVFRDKDGMQLEGEGFWALYQNRLIAGVAPFAEIALDEEAGPPQPELLNLPTWDVAEAIRQMEVPPFKDEFQGVYEGEYDEDGNRSGYGTWTFFNYRYEGQWEYNMPHGQGTLLESRGADSEGNPAYVAAIQGKWVYGLADGPILVSEHMENGDAVFFSFNAIRGKSARQMNVDSITYENGQSTGDETTHLVVQYANYGVVPPWGDANVDPSLSPPPLSALKLPSKAEAGEMVARLSQGENSENAIFQAVSAHRQRTCDD